MRRHDPRGERSRGHTLRQSTVGYEEFRMAGRPLSLQLESIYTRDQCEEDAFAAGLESDALYRQISDLCERTADGVYRIGEQTLDGLLRARHVQQPETLSRVDKARILAGVEIGHRHQQSHAGSSRSLTPPHSRGRTPPQSPVARPSSGALEQPPRLPSTSSSALLLARHNSTALESAATPSEETRQLECETPHQTSRLRRSVSHLSAAAAPLIGAAATSMSVLSSSSATASAAASLGAAGVAAVSGYAQSVTTHEHHTQGQEMSRRLQRIAMAQDRRQHGEAQELARQQHDEGVGLSNRLHREAISLGTRQHRQGLWREQQQHEEEMRVERRLHFEGILSDLREQDREADHDLWEQRTERFQMLMTVSSLLISGGFALAVEGQLPPEPGELHILPSSWAPLNVSSAAAAASSWTANGTATGGGGGGAGGDGGNDGGGALLGGGGAPSGGLVIEVAALHYFLLACGLGLEMCTVMGCLALTSRFAEFMDLRVQKQQLLNKDLRRAAVKMIGNVEKRDAEHDRRTIERFEKVLRQQYVIETCEAGHRHRHVWNFQDWFTQRCRTLSRLVEACFRMGMLAMLGSVMTFQFAHLERGEAEQSAQSSAAWAGFAVTLVLLVLLGLVVPYVVGSSWSWRFWNDWRRGAVSLRGNEPVRFDINDIARKADALFEKIDSNGNGQLDVKELQAAAAEARGEADRKRKEADEAFVSMRLTPEARRRTLSSTASSGGAGGIGRTGEIGGIGGIGGVGPGGRSEDDLLPMSPVAVDDKRRQRLEEEAAATAVLETIIRRLEERARRHKPLYVSGSRQTSRRVSTSARAARAAAPGAAAGGEGSGSFSSGSVRRRGFGLPSVVRRRGVGLSKPWEVTREEWDQAISHALF